ncbi:hypothetical protein L3X38_024456 [Prunus dulcis]|uniref:Uncharacterized protein n=1 Tax=Prunus dulcis TaxID=3755 RepID=A0AAD4VZY8_PRUDU|nr:hypothetical protein L3X38_024456 [Prunus dulcis]
MSDEEQTLSENKKSNSKHSSNSNNNSGMDTSNPYYVHSLDHPAKNKIGLVNGFIKPPSETENLTKYASGINATV